MRLLALLALVLISFYTEAIAAAASTPTPLRPTAEAALYQHLVEVNERWLYETSPAPYLTTISFATETERIQQHLMLVHQVLLQRDVAGLSAKQQARRAASLAELSRYANRGQFPINTHDDQRTPYFVDVQQTHCAVGHLMTQTGDVETVSEISKTINTGYVLPDLSILPQVSAWATEHGFTAAELAWIQPGYPATYLLSVRAFGNNQGVQGGQARAAARTGNNTILVGGDFTQFDGVAASGLVIVSGTSAIPVINPFSNITQLVRLTSSNAVLCFGEEQNTQHDSTLLALFDLTSNSFIGQWRFSPEATVYVHVDSLAEPLLAVGSMQDQTDELQLFRLSTHNLILHKLAQDYVMKGIIYDSYYFNGEITFGGQWYASTTGTPPFDSNQVSFNLASSQFTDDTNVAGERSEFNKLTTGNHPVFRYTYIAPNEFNSKKYLEGEYLAIDDSAQSLTTHRIFAASDRTEVIESGPDEAQFYYNSHLSGLHAFRRDLGSLILTGNFYKADEQSPQADTTRWVATQVGNSFEIYSTEIPVDGAVVSVLSLQDSFLVVGTFTSLNGAEVNHLAYATARLTDVAEQVEINAKVYFATGQLHISFEQPLATDAQLFLYSSDGRLTQVESLRVGQARYAVDVEALPQVLHYALRAPGAALRTGSFSNVGG